MTRFQANERLLELLVGSNLYPAPDVCVRELVQNAWDAVEWRRERGDGQGGTIVVRLSNAQEWFEVEDDGIGMDENDIQQSFLEVGSDKLEALGVDAPPGDQIAFFGIGVLSVFLVATSFTVTTKKLGALTGFRVRVQGLAEDVEIEPVERDPVGTCVRVSLADGRLSTDGVENALRQYVRHVPGVFLEDEDAGTRIPLRGTWGLEDLVYVEDVDKEDALRAGKIGFTRGLLSEGGIVGNPFVLTNAGFLVEARALDLLPLAPVGFGGELDVHPRALNIVMARERFQRDPMWEALGTRVKALFADRALHEVTEGALAEDATLAAPGDSVRRALLIWFALLPEDDDVLTQLRDALRTRILSNVEFDIADQGPAPLSDILAKLPAPRLYIRRIGAPTHIARHIDDEGLPVQFQEEVRDSIRVGALRARRFPVVQARLISFTTELPSGSSTQQQHEFDLISRLLQGSGIEARDIANADPADLDLSTIEQLPILHSLLDVGGILRFASVPDSDRRLVTDPSGVRYLNVRHATVQRLLKAIPEAVSNPLRRRLLEIYLDVEDFKLAAARSTILELLEAPDLADAARAETSPLARQAIADAIGRLQDERAVDE